MGSFARVDANVDRKSGSLNESLAAAAKLAGERPFLAVDASVPVVTQVARWQKGSVASGQLHCTSSLPPAMDKGTLQISHVALFDRSREFRVGRAYCVPAHSSTHCVHQQQRRNPHRPTAHPLSATVCMPAPVDPAGMFPLPLLVSRSTTYLAKSDRLNVESIGRSIKSEST